MEAGASAEDLMWLGRRKIKTMLIHYKHNSNEFKIGLAKKIFIRQIKILFFVKECYFFDSLVAVFVQRSH